MSDPDHFDHWLAARFAQEHRHVPEEVFVAAALRGVRAARRRRDFLRMGWRVAVLAGAVGASPWLIAGVERLSSVLESARGGGAVLSGAVLLGVVVAVGVLVLRVRGR